MARPLRFTPADVPQHVWCRGNQQQNVFANDYERRYYLELLIRHATEFAVRIFGYCEMTNHVHLVLQPTADDTLSLMMNRLDSEYAQKVQTIAHRSGHLWHCRFHAAPMDRSYLWRAMRYIELNPVRAGMVRRAENWEWSSAAAHLNRTAWPIWLDHQVWKDAWSPTEWSEFLGVAVDDEESARIRQSTRSNRPLAPVEAVRQWEVNYGMALLAQPPGPKKKAAREVVQMSLFRSAAG